VRGGGTRGGVGFDLEMLVGPDRTLWPRGVDVGRRGQRFQRRPLQVLEQLPAAGAKAAGHAVVERDNQVADRRVQLGLPLRRVVLEVLAADQGGGQFVGTIGNMLFKLTEPALRPIRRFMPDFGGIDISPIILLLLLFFVRQFLLTTVLPLVV